MLCYAVPMTIAKTALLTIAFCPFMAWAQPAAPLPNFEFRGVQAGRLVDLQGLGFKAKQCEFGRTKDEIACTNGNDGIADVPAISTYVVFKGKIETIDFSFRQSHYQHILKSLLQRYGAPCRTDKTTWQNKLGAKFDNVEAVWCFSTGEMRLQAIGLDLESSLLHYLDLPTAQMAASAAPPKVDF